MKKELISLINFLIFFTENPSWAPGTTRRYRAVSMETDE